jgi:aspartyl-tRNA(Asn)/glutamyl-tRNA(Gln) amidotransferase subunit B
LGGPELAKPAANWVTGELSRLINEQGIEIQQTRVRPEHIADLVRLVHDQILSSTGAKQVLGMVWASGDSVQTLVEREGLKQVSDVSALDPVIQKVIDGNAKQAAEFRAGKDKLLGFFVGQVMKETGGKANPALLGELVKKKLLS